MDPSAASLSEALDKALGVIRSQIYTVIGKLQARCWITPEPVAFEDRRTGQQRDLTDGEKWGFPFDCAWFRFTGTVPGEAHGRHVVLLLDVEGEMCVFDEAGMPVRGLTNVGSGFDRTYGEPGKRVLQFAQSAEGGEKIEVWADAGANDLFGHLNAALLRRADIAVCDDEMRALYYDFEVLFDLATALPEDSPRKQEMLASLSEASDMLGNSDAFDPAVVRLSLAPQLEQRGEDHPLTITAVGQAHLDLAWLWPIRETIRKGVRTFATALDLMDRYDDYVFSASQPQLFLWIKERYPALYQRIKQRVAEGRIEVQGAMWVEPDCNIPCGESLVRQLLYGSRFFADEFGVDVDCAWLPDVFGFSASLPQILRKSGIKYFSTGKLSANSFNKFPYHSFHWQGIDGSTVLAHFLPEGTYSSCALPHSALKLRHDYTQKDVSGAALMPFGIGDGGGGPGAEHLERLGRICDLDGVGPVVQESIASFFDRWSRDADTFPTWTGELYLEYHQGTLTTQARSKRCNRKMELGLRELELQACAAGLLAGDAYPSDMLLDTWREVLLYQFHDILPGSSIKRVYDESLVRYAKLDADVQDLTAQCDRALAARIDSGDAEAPAIVFNSLSWSRNEPVKIDGEWVEVSAAPLGYAVVDSSLAMPQPDCMTASDSRIENDILRVEFDVDGHICSLYDKRCDREVVPADGKANVLRVYEGTGDAWDFPSDYADSPPRGMKLESSQAHIDGPRVTMTQARRMGHSTVSQEISLVAGSARLDFVTRITWREAHTMLRTSFPVAIEADDATFEIQFGHIRRSTHDRTSWERAQYEVAAHKWVDLSQDDYGIALLNDCKYGHKIKGNTIDLALLRSAPHGAVWAAKVIDVAPGEPNLALTDQCDHVLTYSLYPHSGDHVKGQVVRAGYELNVPLRVVPAEPGPGSLPPRWSLLHVDEPAVIVETAKKAEDSDDLVIRLYESAGRAARAVLTFGFPAAAASEVDLMEHEIRQLTIDDRSLELEFSPFEIVSVMVKPSPLSRSV